MAVERPISPKGYYGPGRQPVVNVTSYSPTSLKGLSDVKIGDDLDDNQILVYNKASRCFVNKTYFSPKEGQLIIPESKNVKIETFEDFISLFFPSVPPSLYLTSDPSNYIREYGDNVEDPTIYTHIELGQNPEKPIIKIVYMRGDTDNVIAEGDGDLTSYQDDYTISDNTTYYVHIEDELGRTADSSLSYNFVYPMFVGVVNDGDIYDGISEDELDEKLQKLIRTRGTTSFISSPDNQRYAIVYPKSYGDLKSIKDQNNFETIDDYDKQEITVTDMLDGTDQDYYARVLSKDTTQTDFKNTFYFY